MKDLKNDWRLMNQEKYLMNSTLTFHKYFKSSEDWEHEHCDFCSKKIMENCNGINFCTNEGYSTLDNYHWVCSECFEDFKTMFNWKLV